MDNNFFDAYLSEKPYFSVCYRIALVVYEEALINGRYVSCSWNGSGMVASVMNSEDTRRFDDMDFAMPQVFQLEMDGQALGSHWEWNGFEKETTEKGLHVIVRLKHTIREVEVIIHTLLDGTSVFTRWLEITNLGKSISAISGLSPLSGALQTTRKWEHHLRKGSSLYSLGYMESPNWANEGCFQWHPLPNAGYRFSGRCRRKKHRHPMFILRNEATGEHFFCQLAWSGGYYFDFELDALEGSVHSDSYLSFKAAMDGSGAFRTIDAGETVRSPEVHMGLTFGGLDESVQEMHRHIRKTVMMPQARGRGCWVESGIGPEIDMTEEMTLRMVNDAAEVGTEIFFFDAGWFVPPSHENEWWHRCGDWTPNKERYPNGLKGIRDAVKEKGMLFGLWMDPERFGIMSKAREQHPDWIAENYQGIKAPVGMLNLTIPEVAEWVEAEIAALIETHELDFFRLDNNVSDYDTISCTVRNGFVEDNYWRYYEALYAMFDRLRERYPDVIFENCAGGGGRSDLGMVSRFCHTWVSDWQTAPRSFSVLNGMTMALPPEYVDRVVGVSGIYGTASLEFQLRISLFARPTIGTFQPCEMAQNSVQMKKVSSVVQLYKNFVRTFLPQSKIYHHTPAFYENEPKGWGIIELAAEDTSKGMLGVFQLSNPIETETRVYMKGVSQENIYKVTWLNSGRTSEMSGIELAENGLRISLPGALTSELITYEQIKGT